MFRYRCTVFREHKIPGLNQLPIISCNVQSSTVCCRSVFNFKIMLPVLLNYKIRIKQITIVHNFISIQTATCFDPMVSSSGWLQNILKEVYISRCGSKISLLTNIKTPREFEYVAVWILYKGMCLWLFVCSLFLGVPLLVSILQKV